MLTKNESHYNEDNAISTIAKAIVSSVKREADQKIPILCIGTDKSSGDSFGPFVGTFINQKRLTNFEAYGNLEHPVHNRNIVEYIEKLQKKYKFIIAIDCAMGKSESIGKIQVNQGPIRPGSGIGLNLPSVGEISISGVVGIWGVDREMTLSLLNSVRLNLVIRMANVTARAFARADHYLLLRNATHSKSNTYLHVKKDMKKRPSLDSTVTRKTNFSKALDYGDELAR